MVLMLQFRDDFTLEHERECVERVIPEGQSVRYSSIFDEKLTWDDPEAMIGEADRVIFGASAAFSIGKGHAGEEAERSRAIMKRLRPMLEYVFEHDFPSMGFCLGHHIFAEFLGAPVELAPELAETGAFEITLTEAGQADRMFAGVPAKFYAIEGHQDSVMSLPKGGVQLATGAKSPIQAVRYGKNIYSTQFHGELNMDDLIYRVSRFPQYTKNGVNFERIPTPHGVRVLENFLAP